jgi:hypothetical protein
MSALILASVFAFAIDCYLSVVHRKRLKEKFSTESFALAVIAQNRRVFERLAEM